MRDEWGLFNIYSLRLPMHYVILLDNAFEGGTELFAREARRGISLINGDRLLRVAKELQLCISIYFAIPAGDGFHGILHFQLPQAISLHLSPSDIDFTPGFYNPLTA